MYDNKLKCGLYFSTNHQDFCIQVNDDTLSCHGKTYTDSEDINFAPMFQYFCSSFLSELPPHLTLKPHRGICLLTRETQFISKFKTFIAKHDHPPYSPVWALMTFSCLFKYSLFSEDKDLSPLRGFKGMCYRLWIQFDNWVASSSPTPSIWFAKFRGKQATRNQVLFWIGKLTFLSKCNDKSQKVFCLSSRHS